MRRVHWMMPLTMAVALTAVGGQASALTPLEQDLAARQADLLALTRETAELVAQVPTTSDVPVAAQLMIRLQQLESELRQLTGQVEELNYTVQQMKSRQDRFQSDVEYRLSELEKGSDPAAATPVAAAAQSPAATPAAPVAPGAPPRNLGSIPATANGPVQLGPQVLTANTPTTLPPRPATPTTPVTAAAPAPAVKLPNGTPKQQYEYAFEFVKKQDYPAAEQALRSFVQAHPNDELAGNAQYWLGETHYVRGNFNDAAAQFFDGYRKYPKSPKAPDNLLKLGLSLANTNKTKEACASYARFTSEYPNASDFLKRRVREERARLACG